MAMLHFEGSDFMLAPGDLTPEFREQLETCCMPGVDAAPYIEALMQRFEVTGDPEDCAAYLRGYGAWDDAELADHNANLERLIWLTAGAFLDGEVAYFCTY